MRVFVAVVVVLCIMQAHAQQSAFITYTPRDGLANARVRSAYQDSKGRMYFLTHGGLSVYDGVRFRNYTIQDGLATDMVNDILEIGEDSLLIATNSNQHLSLLVRHKVEVYPLVSEDLPIVNEFLKDDAGVVYMAADHGLFRLDGDTLHKFDLPQFTTDALPYLASPCDAGRYLLFSTHELRGYKGLYLFDKRSEMVVDHKPEQVVFSLVMDPTRQIYVIGAEDRVFMIDTAALQQGKLLLREGTNSIFPDAEKQIVHVAFGTEDIWLFHPDDEVSLYSRERKPVHLSLPSLINLTGMIVDREQILWVCTDGSGVIKINRPQFSVSQHVYGTAPEIKIAHVTTTPDGAWLQSYQGDLFYRTAGQFRHFAENLPLNAEIIGTYNDSLYARDHNTIYAATISRDHALHFVPVIRSDENDFTGVAIVDPDGGILTGSKSGLMYYRNGRTALVHPMHNVDLIVALLIDREGYLWMVPRHTDIIKFALAPDDGASVAVVEAFPLRQFQISPRAAVIDDSGQLWLGTRYHGIYVCTAGEQTLHVQNRYDTGSGLSDNFVTCLLRCPDGTILAGTQSGVERIIPVGDRQYRLDNLTKSSNFFAFIRAVWLEDEDRAYALTNAGTEIEIHAYDSHPSPFAPALLIDQIKVNGIAVAPGTDAFDYQENNFLFNICSPTFIDEKQVRYSYMLEGGTRAAWSEASPAHADIHLLNLRPGTYTLYLRAEFPSTDYPKAEIQYRFTIRPAWWQSTIARACFLAMALAISWTVMRFFSERKLERQKAVLEKQRAVQEERARISSDLHDDLGSGLSSIRFMAEKIKRTQQTVPGADIDRIQSTSDELTDKMNEIIWAMSEQHDTLEDLLSYTRGYAARYCDEHDLLCHISLPEQVPHLFVSGRVRRSVFLCVKEALHNIVKHARAQNIFIDFVYDGALRAMIRDDGIGMPEAPVTSPGHGLRNLKRRIIELGGNLSIQNLDGVMITFSVPMEPDVSPDDTRI